MKKNSTNIHSNTAWQMGDYGYWRNSLNKNGALELPHGFTGNARIRLSISYGFIRFYPFRIGIFSSHGKCHC